MVMTWNAEADAKLFLGVLNLLKDSKTKLDCEYLAKFMGPDCLPGAVQNRIVRLKRMAEKGGAPTNGAGTSADNGSGENVNEDAATADAQVSPQKRTAGRPRGAKASPAKKVKGDAKVKSEVKVKVEEMEMEMEMNAENEEEETEDMETEDVA